MTLMSAAELALGAVQRHQHALSDALPVVVSSRAPGVSQAGQCQYKSVTG